MDLLVRCRTRLSQLGGVAFLAVCALSGKKFEVISPNLCDLMFALGCVFIGLAAVGGIWCALYIAGYKNEGLIDTGLYSMTRNPLYFFSCCGAVGAGLCTESAVLTAVIAAVFALMYPKVIQAEEAQLTDIFGDAFRDYMARVPRFWPKLSLFREPEAYTVTPRVFRREVFDAVWFVWVAGVLELLEVLGAVKILPKLFWIY